MRGRLPPLVIALVEWIVDDPIARAGLLGDLEERYAGLGTRGRTRRFVWLVSEVSGVAVHYLRNREVGMLDELRQDIGLAVRGLFRRPSFSVLVIATLALGIGANTAIFSVVNGLLFEALPYAESERLVLIDQMTPSGFAASVSLPNYRDWKERTRSFDRFSAILPGSTPLDRPAGARVIETGWVHGGFFETLGVEAAIGRFFTEAESQPGAEPVAVLSNTLWLNEFGADPDVVGTTIQLRGEPWTVVGVMPADFAPYADVLVYLPMGYVADQIAWDDRGTGSGTEILARLAAGIDPGAAQEELQAVGAQIGQEVGEVVGVGNLTPLRSWYIGDAGRQAVLLMGAVALVLLVACVNVANLLFVRGERRRGEMAVRSALGASRARVYRQLLTESLVFSVLGGAAGVGVGLLGLEALLSLSGTALPQGFADRIRIDGGVLLFTGSLSLITAVLAGFVPAARSTRTELADTIRDFGRGTQSRVRARGLLIGAEVALSMILLVGAGLFIASLGKLQNVDKGFDGSDVITLRVQLPSERYSNRELWSEFHRELREDIAALPGVSAVSTSNHFPLSGNSWEMLYRDENTPAGDRGESVLLTMASPEFFETFSVDIVRGRSFTEQDRWGEDNIAIVDETLAATRWPGEDPLGKQITFEEIPDAKGNSEPVWRTVVGVARHVRHYELASPSRIEVYTPIDQSAAWGFSSYISVRADTDLVSMVPQIRRTVADLDAEAPLYRIRTLEDVLDQQLGGHRAMRGLLLALALLTLLLGCVGIYSVVSHATAVRVREIGLRIALGGSPSNMIGLVVRDSMAPVFIGVIIGAIGAAALGRLLGSLLYEVGPADPAVLASAGAILATVALLSAWIPARAAATVPPQSALNAD